MSFVPPDWGAETVARYLGAELGRNHPKAIPSIVDAMQRCSSSTASAKQLFEGFVRDPLLALQLVSGGRLVVIMDAFDEWKHCQAFLKCLRSAATGEDSQPGQSGHIDRQEASGGIPPPSSRLKVAWHFTQTLLKKLPDLVEPGNPGKMVAGVIKAFIEIKEGVQQNMDDVDRGILSTAAQFDIIDTALEQYQGFPAMWKFRETIVQELKKLYQLKEGSTTRKTADYEDEKSKIAAIFKNVDEAKKQFELEADIQLRRKVDNIEEALKPDVRSLDSLPKHPDVSGRHSEYLKNSRDEEFKFVDNWTRTSPELILSMRGAAGTGKSTFARHLEEELRPKGRLAAALFMSLVPDWGAETVARYIGAELGRNHAEAIPSIMDAVQNCGSSTTSAPQLFETFVHDPLMALQPYEPLIVVMDAFDEWKHHQGFLKCLECLVPLSHLVKFVILHRAELRPQDVAGISLCTHPFPPASTGVMRRYFQQHLAPVEWGNDKGMEPHEVDELAVKSKGWFVWARTVCSTMTEEWSNASARDILEQALHSELTLGDSDALSKLYQGVVSRSFPSPNQRKFVRKYVQAITVLVEPLTLGEFSTLINMKETIIQDIRSGLHALQTRQPNGSDKTIHPANSHFHLSVIEFFQSPALWKGDPSLCISTLATKSHEMMALECLKLLPKLFPPSPHVASEDDQVVASYATKNWLVHAMCAIPPPDPKGPVRDWHKEQVLTALDELGFDTVRRWALTLLRSTVWRDSVLDELPRHEVGSLMEHFGRLLERHGYDVAALNLSIAALQIAVHLHPLASRWSSLGWAYNELSQVSNSPESCKQALALHRHALQSAAMDVEADIKGFIKMVGWGIVTACTKYRREIADGANMNDDITLLEEAVQLSHSGRNHRSEALRYLGVGLMQRGKFNQVAEDFGRAVQLHRDALALCPESHPDRFQSLNTLGHSLSTRFHFSNELEDLDEALQLFREALTLPPLRPSGQELQDLNELIQLRQEVLVLRPESYPNRPKLLDNLAHALGQRFDFGEKPEDLDVAIQLRREALEFLPQSHPDRPRLLSNLAGRLDQRFYFTKGLKDLDEAVQLQREALGFLPKGHPSRPQWLDNLACLLRQRFDRVEELKDQDEIIQLCQEVLHLCPEGHSDRSQALDNLASSLGIRFNFTKQLKNLDEIIQLRREVLVLCPEGHSDRSQSLENLAFLLGIRFNFSKEVKFLDESIQLRRKVLELHPEGHPDRSRSLENLAHTQAVRFDFANNLNDLDEAIRLRREVLELRPDGHPGRSQLLDNLAHSLGIRFDVTKQLKDLDEIIQLRRHPGRSQSLENLALSLGIRFNSAKEPKDLHEIIQLRREVLELYPEGHPDRSKTLNSLAYDLRERFKAAKSLEDLEESIQMVREALELRTEGHPDRYNTLWGIGCGLFERFQHKKNVEDLREAIASVDQAVECIPVSDSRREELLADASSYVEALATWSAENGEGESLPSA
ncbi:hypothetical protein NMY22_g17105 [Coprinellus aureogranulatus]|nr:hypothetical protein NMY22_g17105 [Coprinellus aureogranulatus]